VDTQIQIAEVILGIESRGLPWDFDSKDHYRSFSVRGLGEDVRVTVRWHPLGHRELGEEVFSARDIPGRVPPNWRLYRGIDGLWNLQVNASAYPIFRQRVAVFQPDFRQGDVYVELTQEDMTTYPYPLTAPLDRVLFVNILTHGLGLMLHACGVALDGKGYVFAGPSDAGKTTLARLWDHFGNATVLGDECLILRRKNNQFWVYGTPWVGEAELFSPLGVPVEQIFFIDHGQQNRVSPLSSALAVEKLLAQSILTPYDTFAVEFGLDFCLDFVSMVPAYQLGFVPDRSAIQLLQGFCGYV
jgi:hypothetical protein